MYKYIGIRVHIVDGLNILYRGTDGVCAQECPGALEDPSYTILLCAPRGS